jgi:Animal haem peroxidase
MLDTIDVSKQTIGPTKGHGFYPRTEENQPSGQSSPTGKFGRMFPELRPLVPPVEALDELGQAMVESTTDDAAGDNKDVPAGFTYLGQFIDHDITFDPSSLQEILVDPLALRNFRTPMLDLDSLYGSGPASQPYLYQRADKDLFLIGKTNINPGGGDSTVPTELPNDLPRGAEGFAITGDPRNDENLIVAQLHLAFLKFHNKIVEGIRNGTIQQESPIRKTPFEEARDLVIWHYQWIVLNDFLRRILDNAQLDSVLKNGRRFYQFTHHQGPFIPVEFSAAAYRFGHSMVRAVYDYNRVFTPLPGGVTPATLQLIFRFTGLSGSGANVPIPSDWIIDWRRFVEAGSGVQVGFSRAINPFLSPPLHNLPGVPPPNSLAVRNLRRGRSLGLPPGQSVARFMGFKPLTPKEVAQGPDGVIAAKHKLHIESPLWYYILKEAEIQGKGKRLGQVGSRMVAEVFIGLLQADSSSFLARKPDWKPVLPAKKAGTFTLADLIEFVGDINPIGDA